VIGLGSPRSEVSGTRLWGLMSRLFPRAEDFFSRFMVWNYCPLIFYDEKTRNLTPDKLPQDQRGPLEGRCDRSLDLVLE
jgi:single-strand selective monofunctional uracil DNA glycosylase